MFNPIIECTVFLCSQKSIFPLPPNLPDPARQGQGGGDDQSLLLQPGADGVGGGRGAVHHKLPSQQLFRRSHEASV